MRLKSFVLSVLLITLVVTGCGNPVVPPVVHATDSSISQFYTPPSTALKYGFAHIDYRGAGFADSSYIFTYEGVVDTSTLDGFAPVGGYFLGNSTATPKQFFETYTYVSDSVIIEYGSSCRSKDNRLVVLKTPLKAGATWVAATDFVTPDGRKVAINAHVDEHLDFTVGGSDYPSVYSISYFVTGTEAADSHADFQNGSRHQMWFAYNTGKVKETAFAANTKALWTNEIRSITAR